MDFKYWIYPKVDKAQGRLIEYRFASCKNLNLLYLYYIKPISFYKINILKYYFFL